MTHKQLVVSALENGTVLDHIPAENVYRALNLLNLKGIENQITIGINLNSKAQGRKGIIKIENKFFEDEELNKLALIAPDATVNIIRDGKLVEKKKLSLPEKLINVIINAFAVRLLVQTHQFLKLFPYLRHGKAVILIRVFFKDLNQV